MRDPFNIMPPRRRALGIVAALYALAAFVLICLAVGACIGVATANAGA